jgi:putative PEP-CTERM system TPR-repeat lipoprotein
LIKRAIILISLAVGIAGCTGKTGKELYEAGVKELHKGNPGGAIVLFRNALEKDQNLTDARYQLAKAYMASHKFEQAEKEFQKVQRQSPGMPAIRLELARLYSILAKPDMAIREAKEYLAANPGSADALEALGVAYAVKNMPEEAETQFLRALQREPAKATTKLELAGLYANLGNIRGSRELLNEVIRANPNDARAYFMLAELEIAAGDKDRALALYNKVVEIRNSDPVPQYKAALIHLDRGDIKTAENTAEELIRKFPKSAEGYRLKGIVNYRQKNFSEAITALQNSLKFHPSIPGYYFLGLSLYQQGELENALSQFRLILDKVPSFTKARLLAGIILLKQKRYDDAISEIRRLLESDDGNALAHNVLGSAYLAKGSYKDGLRELDRAIEINPRIIDAHLKKGIFHLSQGKTGEFETDLSTAVHVAPEMLETRLMLASFYMQRNNHAKALAVLNEGVTGKKSDAALYTCMARVMLADKNHAEGMKYLQKAKGCDPAVFDPYFTLAAYYAGSGDLGKAGGEYSAVLQKDPGNVRAMLQLAMLLDSQGRDSEALSYFLKAKETRKPEAYLALANHFALKKNYKKALSVLDEGTKYAPRAVEILELKGRLQQDNRQYREALRTYADLEAIAPERGAILKINTYLAMNDQSEALNQARRALEAKPGSYFGYMLLASVYLRQEKPDRAIEELNKGLRLAGDNPQAELMLADLYAKAGNNAVAMRTCDDILRRHPGFAPAYFEQGRILEKSGNKKDAVKKYRDALAVSANYVASLNNLAYLYADGYGSKSESVRLAETALALQPDNAGVMDTLGYALLKNGRLQEARKILEKAATLLPDNPTVKFHLALAYKESGDRGAAVAMLQKALDTGEFAEKQQARNLLGEMNRL